MGKLRHRGRSITVQNTDYTGQVSLHGGYWTAKAELVGVHGKGWWAAGYSTFLEINKPVCGK